MNQLAMKVERRIKLWIAQQEALVTRRPERTPAVRLPPATNIPPRAR